jgi:hypothetical protein
MQSWARIGGVKTSITTRRAYASRGLRNDTNRLAEICMVHAFVTAEDHGGRRVSRSLDGRFGPQAAINVTINLMHRWHSYSRLMGSQFRIVTAGNTQQLIDHDLGLTALDRHASKLPCDDTAGHAFIDAVADTDRGAKLLV